MSNAAYETIAAPAPELFRRFFDLTYTFARKNGYVFSAWGKLSIVEHQIVTELDQKTPRRPSDLAARINFPAAQLARTLESLEERGLLRFVPGDTNREKLALITAHGRMCAWELDDHSNHQMNLLAESGSFEEQAALYRLWESMNNALGAPRTVVRPGDHPLRIQSRRSTRRLRLFRGRSIVGGLGYPDLQILSALHQSLDGHTIDETTEIFRAPRATVKHRLLKLNELGLVTHPSEREGSRIRCTPAALTAIGEARESFARFLAEALVDIPLDAAASFHTTASTMIARWKPEYELPTPDRIPAPSFFLRLQIQTLTEFARHECGILQSMLPDELPPNTFAAAAFEGPTPCFSMRVRKRSGSGAAQAQFIIEEFGFSDRVDWESVSRRVAEVLVWACTHEIGENTVLRCALRAPLFNWAEPSSAPPFGVSCDPRAEPLQSFLTPLVVPRR